MTPKHILVATDFGDSSTKAESFGAELAEKLGAKITLLHVWSIPAPSYAEALAWPIDAVEAAARDALGRAHARMKSQHADTEAVLAAGVAWDRILEVAKDRKVDMIVMGTHGRRGLSRLMIGSVVEKVIRLSPVPVVAVRDEVSPHAQPA